MSLLINKLYIFVFLLLSLISCKSKRVGCEAYGSLDYKQKKQSLNYVEIPQEKSRGFSIYLIKRKTASPLGKGL